MGFALTSPAVHDGDALPVQHTCDGTGDSPALAWQAPPAGTRSLALICFDPDAPGGAFYHWGLFNMPLTPMALRGGIPEGHAVDSMTQAVNDFGRCAYGAPCPPAQEAPHRYIFRLHALAIARLALPRGTHIPQLVTAIRPHTLSTASLTTTYARPAAAQTP